MVICSSFVQFVEMGLLYNSCCITCNEWEIQPKLMHSICACAANLLITLSKQHINAFVDPFVVVITQHMKMLAHGQSKSKCTSETMQHPKQNNAILHG